MTAARHDTYPGKLPHNGAMVNPVKSILRYNAGRDPERLAIKYRAMRDDPFTFLRGTCHLFYAQLPSARVLHNAPHAWLCGDAHLENFGSYKGDNRLVYFDLNDFDEAALAPVSWDIVRLVASLHVAADRLHIADAAPALEVALLEAYGAALATGMAWSASCCKTCVAASVKTFWTNGPSPGSGDAT